MRPIVVLSVASSVEDAEFIARELVERRLAACVNIVPGVSSIYRWRGEVEHNAEVQLVIKTSAERFEALREAFVKLHTYELPELIALEVKAGHAPYLAWLEESLG
jgi:periplasmic divalent cation tolerance protein